MRLAYTKAGKWFFGTIIVLFLLTGGNLEDDFKLSYVLSYVVLGLIVGGFVFFSEWNRIVQDEQERRQ